MRNRMRKYFIITLVMLIGMKNVVSAEGQGIQKRVDISVLQQSVSSSGKSANGMMVVGIVAAILIIVVAAVVVVIAIVKTNKLNREEYSVISRGGETATTLTSMNHTVILESGDKKEVTASFARRKTEMLNKSSSATEGSANETVVLHTANPQVKAFLVRKRNGQRTQIDTVEFTVGQDATRVNYLINDNKAISRCHMKIIKRGIRYYVMDLGSTNYTYLNEERVPANEEKEIKNGDCIKLADEEFTLEIV